MFDVNDATKVIAFHRWSPVLARKSAKSLYKLRDTGANRGAREVWRSNPFASPRFPSPSRPYQVCVVIIALSINCRSSASQARLVVQSREVSLSPFG